MAGLRETFPEFYEHDSETLKRIVTTGSVSFDTNVLLDLYRVGRDQREEILTLLRNISDRIWIPYQVGKEYQTRRLDAVADNDRAYDSLVAEVAKTIEKQLHGVRDQDLRETIKKAQKKFERDVQNLRSEHTIPFEEIRDEDPIRTALEEIFGDGSVGDRPDATDLAERVREAEKRIKDGIPPGTGDVGNKSDPSGDALVWLELLAHKASSDRPLLFVTNDTEKGDWFTKLRGQTLGPLPALSREMAAASKHPYHQTTLSGFLRLANDLLDADLDEQTIDTVEKIRPPVKSVELVGPGFLPGNYFESIASGIDISKMVGDHPNLFFDDETIRRIARLSPSGTLRHSIPELTELSPVYLEVIRDLANGSPINTSVADPNRDLRELYARQIRDAARSVQPATSTDPNEDEPEPPTPRKARRKKPSQRRNSDKKHDGA